LLRIITTPNPFGYLLMVTIARRNLRAIAAAKATVFARDEDASNLDAMDGDLRMNTHKQGWVLTLSLILAGWYVITVGPEQALANETLKDIAAGLTVAWFVITFSSVKELFLDSATVLTYLMFAAFTIPWFTIAIANVASPATSVSEKVLTCTTILFAWAAAAIYDSLDLLRGNMDELAMEYFRQGTRGDLAVKLSESEAPRKE